MTERVLRAIACPYVDIIGHPTGRRLLKRGPSKLDVPALIDAAASAGVALEINCNPERLDLNDIAARLARERGVTIVINTDSHSRNGFAALRWGVMTARRAWLERADVLNTRPLAELRGRLRRNRKR